jgi:alpha-L-fucosidase 2
MDILWYRTPAADWKEGLPIGNGTLAGMVMGTFPVERITLNHELLWRGKHRDREIDKKFQYLPEIRKLFFQEQVYQAGSLANEKLGGMGGVSGKPNRVNPYQPAGDLFIETGHTRIKDYTRELNLRNAVAAVRYKEKEIYYKREFFAHSVFPVIAVTISSEKRNLNLKAFFSRVDDPECKIKKGQRNGIFYLAGEFVEGIRFIILSKTITTNGSTKTEKGTVSVKDSEEVTFLITAAVTHNGEDPAPQALKQINSIPCSIKRLKETHIKDYQRYYNRVSLKIDTGSKKNRLPTDEMLMNVKEGGNDNRLPVLYFNYGRYLLISSSRPGGLPANLQGKWNEKINPPWQSDYHFDINLQMNYWPAEVCNLSESAFPLFDYVERLVPHGRITAKKLYNCRGVYLPIQTDLWDRVTPESRGWDVWTGAAAWISQHFWWHYQYSMDKTFLKERCYPLLKECAAFYQDYLVESPEGYLVPVPSQSPENHFQGGTSPVSLCVGATMDIELIQDVLTHSIEASKILNTDRGLRKRWEKIISRLPPLQTGRYGQLQEWLKDYIENEPGHRHISHLYALFPGNSITIEKTPNLAKSAKVSLLRRIAYGGAATGWSKAWAVCCLARLKDGERAYEHLKSLISHLSSRTLLNLHPPDIFQIEGNFGGSAAICEMLLQSHNGTIRLLPALPEEWRKGKVTGLKARGNFTVDIGWDKGAVKRCKITSHSGERCNIQTDGKKYTLTSSAGKTTGVYTHKTGILTFPTKAGTTYILTPSDRT